MQPYRSCHYGWNFLLFNIQDKFGSEPALDWLSGTLNTVLCARIEWVIRANKPFLSKQIHLPRIVCVRACVCVCACVCVHVCMCVRAHTCSVSLVWLFSNPWTITHQAPLPMAFSKQEYWRGLPCPLPGDLLSPDMEPTSPALASRFFTTALAGKPAWMWKVTDSVASPSKESVK